jgi:hypothetical protein
MLSEAARELQAQQNRIRRFSKMLNAFRDFKANAPAVCLFCLPACNLLGITVAEEGRVVRGKQQFVVA